MAPNFHRSEGPLGALRWVRIGPVPGPARHTYPILAEDGDHDNSDDDDHLTEQQPCQQEAPPDPVLTEDDEEQRPCEHCTVCSDNMNSTAT